MSESLDVAEAAQLAGVSVPQLARLIDLKTIASHAGRRVLRDDVLAWQREDQWERRAALVLLAREIDLEVFG